MLGNHCSAVDTKDAGQVAGHARRLKDLSSSKSRRLCHRFNIWPAVRSKPTETLE